LHRSGKKNKTNENMVKLVCFRLLALEIYVRQICGFIFCHTFFAVPPFCHIPVWHMVSIRNGRITLWFLQTLIYLIEFSVNLGKFALFLTVNIFRWHKFKAGPLSSQTIVKLINKISLVHVVEFNAKLSMRSQVVQTMEILGTWSFWNQI